MGSYGVYLASLKIPSPFAIKFLMCGGWNMGHLLKNSLIILYKPHPKLQKNRALFLS